MSVLSRKKFPTDPGMRHTGQRRRHWRSSERGSFRNGPLISIVVPAYLTPERFLRQMLDSLLAQTYQNWELCLANGSPEDPDMQTRAEILRRDG